MSKKKSKYIKQYPFGGFTWDKFGQAAGNFGRSAIDTPLTALGMGNVIPDSDYKGAGANIASGYANTVGGIGKTLLPMAANMVAPGSGMAVGALQQGLGNFNPQGNTQDPNPQIQQSNGQQIGNMLNMGMQMGQGLGIFAYGGDVNNTQRLYDKPNYSTPYLFKYANGGTGEFNAELEKQENAITPSGDFTQYDGASHEAGGIKTDLPNGAIIFSDRLKPQGSKKTYAKLNKPNNTNKEDKILDNNNSTTESKKTAELMKKVKQANSQELFEDQEATKTYDLHSGLYKFGGTVSYKNGGIHIKPSAKGSFTRWAKNHGMSVSEAASKVMANKDNYSSAIVKKANFAKNAAGWKHADGGVLNIPESEISKKVLVNGLPYQYPNGGKVTMSKPEFMDEHRELVRILKSGSKAEQLAEANEQAEEMSKYPGGGEVPKFSNQTDFNKYYQSQGYQLMPNSQGTWYNPKQFNVTPSTDQGRNFEYQSLDPNVKLDAYGGIPSQYTYSFQAPQQQFKEAKPFVQATSNRTAVGSPYKGPNGSMIQPYQMQDGSVQHLDTKTGQPIQSSVTFARGGVKSDIQSGKLYNKMYNFKQGDANRYSPYRQYPNGGPFEQQGFFYQDPNSYAEYGNQQPPWYKGIGDALNGEIQAGRMQMTQPTTGRVGELDPVNKSNMRQPWENTNMQSLNNTPNKRFNWKDAAYYGAGTLAQSAGPLAYLAQQGKKYDTQKFYNYTPQQLDPSSALRDADMQSNQARYDLANASGGNSGSYLSNRIALAGQNTLNKASIRNQYDNMNAGISNQGQQFNIANRYMVDDRNQANKDAAYRAYYGSIDALGSNTAMGMRDYRADQMDQERMGYLPYMFNNPEFNKFYSSKYGK